MTGARDILSGQDRSLKAKTARLAMHGLEPAYRAAVALRNAGFDRGWRRVHPLGRPTISVGNLSVGGTGKTPMVIALCQKLIAAAKVPAVLLRGYKSHGGRSDEAEVLAATLGDRAVVHAEPDRVAGARAMLARRPDVSVFVLDDGFQHRRARRDLDLVLLDAARPFGDGHCLPRGLLREPMEQLRRADAVVLTHADLATPQQIDACVEQVQRLTGRAPAAVTAHEWIGLRDHRDAAHPIDTLAGLRVIGVSGLGDPASFERSLQRHAGQVARCIRFADHAHYTAERLRILLDEGASDRVEAIVTTEKDWVKWAVLFRGAALPVPIYRAQLALRFVSGEAAVDTLLAQTLAGHA